jgi:outer membrane PBP1 activator LpoA protein
MALGGCAMLDRGDGELSPLLHEARRLASQDSHLAAARAYEAAATKTSGNTRAELLMAAAQQAILVNEAAVAQGDLTLAEQAATDDNTRARVLFARVRLAIQQRQIPQALELLTRPVPPELATQRLLLHAQTLMADGDVLGALKDMVARGRLLSADEQLRNEKTLWEMLLAAPANLDDLIPQATEPVVQGYVALAAAVRSAGADPGKPTQAVQRWQRRYPNHPANQNLLASLGLGGGLASQPLQTMSPFVAALLPNAPNLQGVVTAIRDGIMAAHQHAAQPQPGGVPVPEVRFYDEAGTPDSALDAVRHAVDDGALAIMGPLLKQTVEALARQGPPPRPLVALNRPNITTQTPPGLYLFGLPPEDEARAVARRALSDGHHGAWVILPADVPGERATKSFQDTFTQEGGVITAMTRLAPQAVDVRAQLAGDWRHAAAADVIFMPLPLDMALRVLPQLRTTAATLPPIYAMGDIYNDTTLSQESAPDFEGIVFPITPLELDPAFFLGQAEPSIQSRYGAGTKLFALGMDAFTLAGRLCCGTMQLPPDLAGATGRLIAEPTGIIRREPAWAQYQGGAARPFLGVSPAGSM